MVKNKQDSALTKQDKQLLENLKDNFHFGTRHAILPYFDEAAEPGFGEKDEEHQLERLQNMAYILMNVSCANKEQTDRIISSYPYYQKVYSKHRNNILAKAAKNYRQFYQKQLKEEKQSDKMEHGLDEDRAKKAVSRTNGWTWPAKRPARSMSELIKILGEVHGDWVAANPKHPIMPGYIVVSGIRKYVKLALPVIDPDNQDVIIRMPLYYYNPSEHIYQANERTLKALIESLAPELISRSEILDVLDSLRTRATRDNVVQLTQAKHPELVAVKNGVFNWVTKKFRPFNDKTDVFDAKLGTDYNPKATKEPLFGKEQWGPLKFIKEISVDEETGQYDPKKFNLIMQGFFDAVARVYWRRKMLLFVSKMRTGKSTLINILRATMGSQANYSTLTPDQFDDPVRLAELVNNKTAIIGDDMNAKHKIKNDKNFKNLLSPNGVVDVKMLYRQPFSIQPRVFIIATSNDRIRFADGDNADYDRIVTVHLTKQFLPGKNDDPKVIKDYSVSRKTAEFMLNWLLNHMTDKPFVLPDESKRYDEEYHSEDNAFNYFKNNIQNQIISPIVPTDYMYMLYKANAMANGYPEASIYKHNEFIRHMKDEVPSWKHKRTTITMHSKQTLPPEQKDKANWNLADAALFESLNNRITGSRHFNYNPENIDNHTYYNIFKRVTHTSYNPTGKKELGEILNSVAQFANSQLPKGIKITAGELQTLLKSQVKQGQKAADAAVNAADKLAKNDPQKARIAQSDPDITLAKAIKTCEKDPDKVDIRRIQQDKLDWHAKHDPLKPDWLLVSPWVLPDMIWLDKNNHKHSLGDINTFETLVRQMTDYQKKYQLQSPIIKSTEYDDIFLLNSSFISRAKSDWDPSRLIKKRPSGKKKSKPVMTELSDRQRNALELIHQLQNSPTAAQKKQIAKLNSNNQARDWQLVSPVLPGGLEFDNWRIENQNNFNELKKLNNWFMRHNEYKDKHAFLVKADSAFDVAWLSKNLFDQACSYYKQQMQNKDLLQ